MLLHCVFCQIPADADRKALAEVYAAFASLVPRIDGMLSFDCGPNRDYEQKSAAFTEGFVVTFRDRAAHLAYENHPDHKAAGGRLVNLCSNGYGGITVFDIDSA